MEFRNTEDRQPHAGEGSFRERVKKPRRLRQYGVLEVACLEKRQGSLRKQMFGLHKLLHWRQGCRQGEFTISLLHWAFYL